MTVMAGLGAMSLLAFAVPFLTSTGIDDTAVAPLLLVYGAACLVGNVIGGRLADRGLGRALTITLTGTGLALLIAAAIGTSIVGAVVGLAMVGSTYFSTFPPLNTWIATSTEGLAPDLALAVNSAAFNIGIAAAGWLGGAVLTAGLDAANLPYLGIGALIVAVTVTSLLRRTRQGPSDREADTTERQQLRR